MARNTEAPLTPTDDDKKSAFEHVEHPHREALATDIPLHPGHHGERAAQILKEAGKIEYTEADDRRVLRTIDLWVLTPMVIIYMLQQMDKSAVSYSSIFNIIGDLKLVGTQYSWLASVVYIAQLAVQPLSSYALVKFDIKWWLVGNMAAWGTVVLASSAAKSFTGMLIARLLLGIFEATLAPSFIALCQMWWRRREQTYRVVGWNVANSIAGIIGPLLSFGVGHAAKNGGVVKPYQAILIILGALTLACVPIVAWMLPSSPVTAKCLDKGNDRVIALERLRDNNMGVADSTTWNWAHAKEAALDIKTYGWCLMLFCCAFPSGGLAAFSGLLITGLGFKDFDAILLSIPPAVIGLIVLLTATWLTNKIRIRFIVIATLTLFPIGGALALRFVPTKMVNARLGCFYVAYFYAALQPSVYAWACINQAGKTKTRVVTAMFFVSQCVGNIAGPFVYRAQDKPNYFLGIEVDVGCWACLTLTVLAMAAYMHRLNKKNERRREALGHVGKKLDTSIMTVKESNAYKEGLKQDTETAGMAEHLNENAFDDLTDLQNPDFQYAI